MTGVEIVVALAIAVGLAGILVPLLPGVLLVLVAIVVWAVDLDERTGWVVLGVAAALLVAVVVGSGIFAERLSPGDTGLQLLENSTATAAPRGAELSAS